jgi:hypothetical protein
MKKKICAIDPGTYETALISFSEGSFEYRYLSNSDLLSAIYTGEYSNLFIEMITSYGMPVGKETFETCLWIGRFIEAARTTGTTFVYLVPRREIKLNLCGSARAKDANIRQALIDRYGPTGTKATPGGTYGISKHGWAALAVYAFADDYLSGKLKESLYPHTDCIS